MSPAAADRRIRSLRPLKPPVDPSRPHGWLVEEERRPGGEVERALTVFLVGAECPFTCSFCDLWHWTLDGPTPPGALPAQISTALASLPGAPHPRRIKLYNASNFFDRRAVPRGDLPAIADLVAPFAGGTVESHASTVGPAVLRFAERIPGRLEVAMGLETIHPTGAAHLNKRLDPGRFARAAEFLAGHSLDLRVFALLGVPHVPAEAQVEWAVRTVEHALAAGAALVSIIPVRDGNGELERLQARGEFTPPTLRELEDALEACAALGPGVVTADLWDVERLPGCAACREERVERLREMNSTGAVPAPVECGACGGEREGPAPDPRPHPPAPSPRAGEGETGARASASGPLYPRPLEGEGGERSDPGEGRPAGDVRNPRS